MGHFTQHWRTGTWDDQDYKEGKPLNHTAGNGFRSRGVEPEDFIYVVTVKKGKLFLLGRMKVRTITTKQKAERELHESLWGGEEHIMSENHTAMHFNRRVPDGIVKNLRFGANKLLDFDGPGILNRQTLRGVRRMSLKSAKLLDEFLNE